MLDRAEISDIKRVFLEACLIDNESRLEKEIATWTKKQLRAFSKTIIQDKKNNLFTKIKGTNPPLLLNAHIDSVPPCKNKEPHYDGENFFSKGDTILGADNLVGVVAILSALKYLKTHKTKHRSIEVLFTTMEEIGGIGIKNFDFSSVESKHGLVIDSLAPVGTIIIKSPIKYNLSIIFEGVSVHGKSASNGESAIKMMADFINHLPLGKIKDDIILNIGTIKGGKSLNTVPGEAKISGSFKIFTEGEIRSGKEDEAQKIINLIYKHIKKTKHKHPKGDIFFSYELNRPGYIFNQQDEFIAQIKKAIKNSKITAKLQESLGVSDANTLNMMGIKSVLLGTGVKYAHTTNETVALHDIVKLTEIIINYCKN